MKNIWCALLIVNGIAWADTVTLNNYTQATIRVGYSKPGFNMPVGTLAPNEKNKKFNPPAKEFTLAPEGVPSCKFMTEDGEVDNCGIESYTFKEGDTFDINHVGAGPHTWKVKKK